MLNNGQAPSNYLQRVKQQAKKLYSLNKKSTIDLSSLSKVQDVMAQVNGYPNWHAFQTHLQQLILKEKSLSTPQLYLNSIDGKEKIEILCNENTHKNFFNIIAAKPGMGKTTILKRMIRANILDREQPVKTAILHGGSGYDSFVEDLNSKKTSSSLSVNMKKNFINLFDVPIGLNDYSKEMSLSIFEALKYMTNEIRSDRVKHKLDNNLDLFILFSETISQGNLVNKVNKPYVKGVLLDVDEAIKINNKSYSSWKEVTDDLLSAGKEVLGRKSQQMASPTISDFLVIAKERAVLDVQIEWLKKIEFFIKKYPFFNKEMNWIPSSYDFLCFNVDNYYSFNEMDTVRFFAPFLIQNMLITSYYEVRGTARKEFAQFYVDEFDRYTLPVFLNWALNSKNNNVGFVISSQILTDVKEFFFPIESSLVLISQRDWMEQITKNTSVSFINNDVLKTITKNSWLVYMPAKNLENTFYIPDVL